LAARIRALAREIGSPVSVGELDVEERAYEAQVEKLVDDAFNDTQIVTAPRSPTYEELGKLFLYAFEGREIDF